MPYALCGFINSFNERRNLYGNTHSLGNIPNHSKGKGEEGKENDLDGLLQ
jgi:hypothetical protein